MRSHDGRVFALALASGAPALAVALAVVWHGHTPKVEWTATVALVGVWLGCGLAVRARVSRPLETIANLLAALREGDFSMRGRHTGDDALGLAMSEVNALGDVLKAQRLSALEATALLRRVMSELDVAIFTFGSDGKLWLMNPAGERLLGVPGERAVGRTAAELGVGEWLDGAAPRRLTFRGQGPFELRRSTFRQHGLPHQLVVLPDLRRALREEELAAWQRLVRVLGHEINNSLAPIQSIAQTLGETLSDEDSRRGLAVISRRAESLGRFLTSYAKLAKLPPPRLAPVEVGAWVRRIVALETRLPVAVEGGPDVTLQADADQLDQLLINVVKNAVEAAAETGGGVRVRWAKRGGELELTVEDDGPGLGHTANLFVPFFTTKPGGTGIGLVLSRQIAEAHRGSFTVEDRPPRGCLARLRLPLS